MSFRILGLSPQAFRPYFQMSDAALAAAGALRPSWRSPDFPAA
jgi:hypothetical protein